ncbi:DNA processing protein [Gordonia effusa NBRC 100432]|uniref:DNA processing protein n=1 Tax=Gordonia effusa NBRC 100432 TaxID=1077974 RepID=H0QZ02_9ACTN|nr:DNA-processing protein DprA [Gordonia effusa]GAB18053.1 DNA processing protein [Gordonia effusa NBRC 100432]
MSAYSEEQRAWAYLARVAEPPCGPLRTLTEEIGAIDAAQAVRRRVVPPGYGGLLTNTRARYEIDSAISDLDAASRVGARLVTPADDEWPGWSLMALAQADTADRGGPPLALWVRGSPTLTVAADCAVALVGSRAASSYGEYVAASLAAGIAADGSPIVSGAAYGIDGVAHRSVLASGGLTAAVLACGIDRDYPAGHARLLAQIAASGVVISEYPPGTTAAKHRFLTRNRLVAALSSAVVVVEAGRRSGAANTAAWARKLGRPLGAVPGPVTSAMSVGCHSMIADGLATLVTTASEVMSLVRPDGAGGSNESPSRSTDGLTPIQRQVHDAIPRRGATTVDQIAYSAGIDLAVVRSALAAMDVAGVVVASEGGWKLA